jgi:hypothetical protein
VVFDPDDIELGRVAVGAVFNNQIKFSIADGATDFAIGDAFSVTVGIEESDYQVAAFNPTAANNAAPAVIIARAAEVRGVDLTWPAVITAAQQAEAIRQLEKLNIIIR